MKFYDHSLLACLTKTMSSKSPRSPQMHCSASNSFLNKNPSTLQKQSENLSFKGGLRSTFKSLEILLGMRNCSNRKQDFEMCALFIINKKLRQ